MRPLDRLRTCGFRTASLAVSLAFLVSCARIAFAQSPVGTIGGSVSDASGSALISATVSASETQTGTRRTAVTGTDGRYQLTHLEPGTYALEVTMAGFRTAVRQVMLRVGDRQTLDFQLHVGAADQQVDVTGNAHVINATNYGVSGSVGRAQIDQLPLNGRSYLELAQLQPSVQVLSVSNPGAFGNNYQRVLIGGAYYSQTRITVDGSTVGDRFVGGTTVGLSQESVEEFQVASFNLDPANGLTGSGAINLVSRRGSNEVRGSAFTYFRDHHLAAYPGFRRDARQPDSPSFSRWQSGGSGGGPLRRDRLFWFANYERNDQDAVFAVTNNHPVFSKLDGIFPNPLTADLLNVRLDARPANDHQVFLRVSSDHNDTISPAVAVGLPSNWQSVQNASFQIQLGLTSVVTARFVNDLRIAYNHFNGDLNTISQSQCRDAIACVGVEAPNILVFDAPQFRIGKQFNSPFSRRQRTFQIVDHMTWQRGNHQVRWGGEWERSSATADWTFREPAQMTLWGPSNLQTAALRPLYDALPASLKDPNAAPPTVSEILQLPLRNFTTGIGDPALPGPFNAGDASSNDRLRLFAQDVWRIRPSLTLSYGLAYSVDSNLFHHDLDYPQYLAPILGSDLRAPRRDLNDVDPSAGIAWTVGASGRTVVRGGAGIYHDEASFFWKARDRAFIGPSGNGRMIVDGSVTGLDFSSIPTSYRGEDLLAVLPALRSQLAAKFGNGTDLSVRGIEVIKQADQVVAPDSTTGYSVHANVGMQRELPGQLVLTADYVFRRYADVGPLQGVYYLDRNRFARPRVTGVDPISGVVSFVRDPVIPLCGVAQAIALDPRDACSTGPIIVFSSDASFLYQGLHLTLEKRYGARTQFTVSYALSRNTGFLETGFTDFDDHSTAYGNIPDHRRHRLVVSGSWTLPDYVGPSRLWRGLLNSWTVSFVSQTHSAPALDTVLMGLDLDGDGISQTLLPGTNRHNMFGRGVSESELRGMVDQFNSMVEANTRRVTNPDGTVTIVRPRTPFNQIITPIVLPEQFAAGDSFLTQDLRITKTTRIAGRAQLSLIGEVFNVFNIANLTGYSGVLNQPNYGQPSARVAQVFGTGGPRAFQLAARLMF